MILLVKILFHEFLSRGKDYIEHMATFTVLVKIYSIEYFYNTEVPGFGETFVQQKVSPRIIKGGEIGGAGGLEPPHFGNRGG